MYFFVIENTFTKFCLIEKLCLSLLVFKFDFTRFFELIIFDMMLKRQPSVDGKQHH